MSVKFNMLFNKLNLGKSQKSELRDILRDMVDESILTKNGKYYELFRKHTSFEGTVVINKDGEYAVEITNADGYFSLIVPSSFLNQTEFEKCRAWLLDTAAPFSNINLGDGVFDDVATPTCIIGFGNNQLDRNLTLKCYSP